MRWIRFALLSLVLYSCSEQDLWPSEKFDSHVWKATAEGERHRFAKDLIASRILIGKTRPEVIALLGSPSQLYGGDDLHYLIKLGGIGFDQVFMLDVRLERQTVREVAIRGD